MNFCIVVLITFDSNYFPFTYDKAKKLRQLKRDEEIFGPCMARVLTDEITFQCPKHYVHLTVSKDPPCALFIYYRVVKLRKLY